MSRHVSFSRPTLGASLGAGVLNEVMIAFDQLFIGEDMTTKNADLRAFKSEFIVEYIIAVLLLWPAFLILRKSKPKG